MKISFFETRDKEREVFASRLSQHDLFFCKEKLSLENIKDAEQADIISVFVNSEIKKEVIDALPCLKLIAARSTGFDHIDVRYAGTKGIKVASVPNYGARTVAEFAFGLILTLSRKIYRAVSQMKEKISYDTDLLQGFDLCGKTIGVVGTGRIGKNMVRIAKGFGLKILATDLYPDNDFAEEEEIEYVPLDALLSSSDIVTIHTPFNETTYHLINRENIKLMKKGAILINTARGEIVDTEALVASLRAGQIGGAGLDVLEGERSMKAGAESLLNKELIAMRNVVVTPHVAFFSAEAEAEIIRTTSDNIELFIAGTPQNIVDIK